MLWRHLDTTTLTIAGPLTIDSPGAHTKLPPVLDMDIKKKRHKTSPLVIEHQIWNRTGFVRTVNIGTLIHATSARRLYWPTMFLCRRAAELPFPSLQKLSLGKDLEGFYVTWSVTYFNIQLMLFPPRISSHLTHLSFQLTSLSFFTSDMRLQSWWSLHESWQIKKTNKYVNTRATEISSQPIWLTKRTHFLRPHAENCSRRLARSNDGDTMR